MQLAETFDHVADLYDAARPGYPAALFETLVRAGRLEPGDPVLEVGGGTGQSTQGLRRQGLALVQRVERRVIHPQAVRRAKDPIEERVERVIAEASDFLSGRREESAHHTV